MKMKMKKKNVVNKRVELLWKKTEKKKIIIKKSLSEKLFAIKYYQWIKYLDVFGVMKWIN